MHISELDTPALAIDLDIMERNLTRVADYTRAHGLRLRPHTKTHKIPALGKRQVELGAAGLTVAKVGEAEVMLASGTPDLLIAYPVIGRRKLERLVKVARETRVTVSLDSLYAAKELSDAAQSGGVEFGVLAEVDVGLGRVGVPPAEVLSLVDSLRRLPKVTFEGIAFYPGHIKEMNNGGGKQLSALNEAVRGMLSCLEKAGVKANVVSGGSTPSLFHSHLVEGLNEIRPGTYIFNDRNTVATGACGWQDCAASILVTVVSTAVKDQMIIDGGSKTFSSDGLITGADPGFGRVVEAPDAAFVRMNEEHGYVDMHNSSVRFEIGQRVRMIPNHICAAMNLHDTVYGIRGDQVETTWKVEGRGKLQ